MKNTLAKHTLILEPDYDFVLIGISSHEKDYRICWELNNILNIDLTKIEPLEIKGKKQLTPSHFSCFTFADEENFLEYFVLSNMSEAKLLTSKGNTLFKNDSDTDESTENEWLVPEYKQMDYFYIIKGEVNKNEEEEIIKKIKEINAVLTTVLIDASTLKSRQNLIF